MESVSARVERDGEVAPTSTDTTSRDALARNLCARLCNADRTEDELRVIDDMLSGLERGFDLVGPFIAAKEARDMNEEAAQECRDLLVYLAMQRVVARHKERERIRLIANEFDESEQTTEYNVNNGDQTCSSCSAEVGAVHRTGCEWVVLR